MLKPGDIVLAMFYFADYQGAKLRPSLVVSKHVYNKETNNVVIAAISSKPVKSKFEVPIQYWQESGLRFPSKVQVGRLLTVDSHLVKQVGHLAE